MAIPDNIVIGSTGDFSALHREVLDKVGGLANLAELIDKDGDGSVDEGILLGAERTATTEVLAMVEPQSLVDLLPPYPRAWVLCASWLAVLNCWLSGAQGQAFPSRYQAEVDNVRQNILPLIRTGKAGNVDAGNKRSNNQSIIQVTHNSAFSLDRTRGLW